jgi:hypothetical protein
MNLTEMKARLRARLNERDEADAFDDDADLIPLLNEGSRYVAKKLHQINRRVNIVSDCADIEVGVRRYPLPVDFLFEFEVWVGAEGERVQIFAVEPYRDRQKGYYMDGMWINLTWDPDEYILCGLNVKHCAAISMINDGDMPPIPADLHMAIVVAAERFAVPQVGEAAQQQLAELNDLLGDLPGYYKQENAEQPRMRVLGRQYGPRPR